MIDYSINRLQYYMIKNVIGDLIKRLIDIDNRGVNMLAIEMRKRVTPPKYTAREERRAVQQAKVKVRCKLQSLLDERNLTRSGFAEITGLTSAAVRGLCENTAKRVDIDTLAVLCSYFDANWSDLFEVVPKDEEE